MVRMATGFSEVYDAPVFDLRMFATFGALGTAFAAFSYWINRAVSAALTPQRFHVTWLRRFRTDRTLPFRMSKVVDDLTFYGLSSTTLQDADVRFSRVRRSFWQSFTLPLFGLAFIVLLVVTGGSPNIPFLIVAALVAASAFGAIRTTLSNDRDDFNELVRLTQLIQIGRHRRGTAVLKIPDARWKEAVSLSLSVSDLAIIDVSDVTPAISWEVDEALRVCSRDGVVFICREGSSGAKALNTDIGRMMLVQYPVEGGGKSVRLFQKRLLSAIFRASG
jgi:hypothetical protein